MQARFYLPMWGRFASPDPGKDQHFEDTQSWNIYSYTRNNPIAFLDPNGKEIKMDQNTYNNLRTDLNKLATGAKLDYNQKTGLLSIAGVKGQEMSKGAQLLQRAINNKHTLTVSLGSSDKTTGLAAPGVGADASARIGTGDRAGNDSMREVWNGPASFMNMLTTYGAASDQTSWEATPRFVRIGHEFIHGLHLMEGTVSAGDFLLAPRQVFPGRIDREKPEESRTLGVPGYTKGGDITENDIRGEHGMRPAMAYGSGAVVTVTAR